MKRWYGGRIWRGQFRRDVARVDVDDATMRRSYAVVHASSSLPPLPSRWLGRRRPHQRAARGDASPDSGRLMAWHKHVFPVHLAKKLQNNVKYSLTLLYYGMEGVLIKEQRERFALLARLKNNLVASIVFILQRTLVISSNVIFFFL